MKMLHVDPLLGLHRCSGCLVLEVVDFPFSPRPLDKQSTGGCCTL